MCEMCGGELCEVCGGCTMVRNTPTACTCKDEDEA